MELESDINRVMRAMRSIGILMVFILAIGSGCKERQLEKQHCPTTQQSKIVPTPDGATTQLGPIYIEYEVSGGYSGGVLQKVIVSSKPEVPGERVLNEYRIYQVPVESAPEFGQLIRDNQVSSWRDDRVPVGDSDYAEVKIWVNVPSVSHRVTLYPVPYMPQKDEAFISAVETLARRVGKLTYELDRRNEK